MPPAPVETMEWENPPPKNTERYDWSAIADKLLSRPNEWLKVFDCDVASLATAIRIDGIRALSPRRGFVVRTANNVRGNPRTCSMWLLYNPDKDEEKT